MLHIEDAKYIKDYKVWVRFNNGQAGEVDLSDFLWGPVFEPLKNKKLFKTLHVDPVLETIAWDNGADLAPEALLAKLKFSNL